MNIEYMKKIESPTSVSISQLRSMGWKQMHNCLDKTFLYIRLNLPLVCFVPYGIVQVRSHCLRIVLSKQL